MNGNYNGLYSLLNLFFLLLLLGGGVIRTVKAGEDSSDHKNVYVVYMGAASEDTSTDDHLQLLASVLRRKDQVKNTLLRSYQHGFSGFTARLSKEEADAIGKKPGVVSVFVDPILQLHTTRSWDFLQQSVETDSTPRSDEDSLPREDTIIGLLDTGIWPESQSFDDTNMGAIPTRWKGKCVQAPDFNASNCNRKLIGAKYYQDSSVESDSWILDESPRDTIGHGTHTASTAAGSPVIQASYYGLAQGTAKGGSTSSQIAMYKVCTSIGCPGSAILAGFDDAIADGVDVLSLSLGASSYFRPNFSSDPIAIGAFHAVAKGITVVCSAGNNGPTAGTIVNAAPWILTVAATTIDRILESDVALGGNNKAVKGVAINFSNLNKSAVYPLIYGGSAKSNSNISDESAGNCDPDTLNGDKIKGKIVLCKHSTNGVSKSEKIDELKSLGAIGLVLVHDLERATASPFLSFPVSIISSEGANEIFTYINSTKNPVATILPTVSVTKYKPAPAVAFFSSRGPSPQTKNILKPDIAAPGVNILAAWPQTNGSSVVPPGQKLTSFNLLSGTSMACPHVSGVAASIKSWNPTWSPSAIRSAIMTTAIQTNNDGASLTTDSGSTATPYDYGAGEVSPTGALQVGLVYEVETGDYVSFLCNYGYQASTIKLITSLPKGFECPSNSSTDLISNLNYPSIAITKFNGKGNKTVHRTVTNVGADEETVYLASVKSPNGLNVKVVPDRLQFTKSNKKLSYQVVFSLPSSSSSLKGDAFGSITWTNGKQRVRSPFVVSI